MVAAAAAAEVRSGSSRAANARTAADACILKSYYPAEMADMSRQNATKMMTQRRLVLPAAALCSSILFRSASSMSFAACKSIRVRGSGETAVNGVFSPRNPSTIPAGFDRTCVEMGWPTEVMWKKLSDGKRTWFESENESYIYWNQADGKWWIDEPSGAGKYIVFNDDQTPPEAGWAALPGAKMPLPTVEIIED